MRKIIFIIFVLFITFISLAVMAGATYSPPSNLNATLILNSAATAASLNVTLILDEGAVAPPVDTCTYSGSGTWNVNCSDNCVVSTQVNLNGNYLFITGPGKFTANAPIRHYGYIIVSKGCAASGRFEP